MSKYKEIHLISGGTVVDITHGLALCAPAFGWVADSLNDKFNEKSLWQHEHNLQFVKTYMADDNFCSKIRTNDDMRQYLSNILVDENLSHIILASPICKFKPVTLVPKSLNDYVTSILKSQAQKFMIGFGGNGRPLKEQAHVLELVPEDDIISLIKEERPDVHLTLFHSTPGKGLDKLVESCKEQHFKYQADLVFGCDIIEPIQVIHKGGNNCEIYNDRNESVKGLHSLIMKTIDDNSVTSAERLV